MEEPDDRADPSSLKIGVVPTDVPSSFVMGAISEASESITAVPEPAHGSNANEVALTSPVVELLEV